MSIEVFPVTDPFNRSFTVKIAAVAIFAGFRYRIGNLKPSPNLGCVHPGETDF